MRKVVLVSSGQPSANPRLVKEATALHDAGYDVKVIYCPISPWADAFDDKLMEEYPGIQWICVGPHPHKNKVGYCGVRFRKKLFEVLYRSTGNLAGASVKSAVFYSQELKREASKYSAGLYIGHNLGALPAVAAAAAKHGGRYAFDCEDYHRGEGKGWAQKRVIDVEDKYYPAAAYLSAASPETADRYRLHYGRPVETIVNVFSKKFASAQVRQMERPIRLFWFSQFVGRGRGLEDILRGLEGFSEDEYHLTLMGNCTHEMKRYFSNISAFENIEFKNPQHPHAIFETASCCDIGLALEPSRDENNDIALSNKLFTYLLAGNAVIYSDSTAHASFFKENSGTGTLYQKHNVKALHNVLRKYVENTELLLLHKNEALRLAKEKYNWEIESKKFLALVERQFA